jgi:ribose 5-phosphate isomerase A
MTLGLGTGSTAVHFIDALGERVRQNGWRVRAVPTSERSRIQAEGLGIPIVDLGDAGPLDLAIDGADETDRHLSLIKGGGGALLREKLVAAAARQFIVVADSSKLKETLGAFPLPVAIVPFGWQATVRRLERDGVPMRLRQSKEPSGGPFVTDDGHYILDMQFGAIADPVALERDIKQITGVVDVGLFVGLASRLILGFEDGHVEELSPLG